MTKIADALRQLQTHISLCPDATISYDANWERAGRPGSFDPKAGILHHTASAGTALGTCRNGRPDVAGPLVQVHVDRKGRITVICAGKANHAGAGSAKVLQEASVGIGPTEDAKKRGLPDDGSNLNANYFGIEMDHVGTTAEQWGKQLEVAAYVYAVVCSHMGWTSGHIVGHRQSTARKPDPVYVGALRSMGDFRAKVDTYMARLRVPTSTSVTTPARKDSTKPLPTPTPVTVVTDKAQPNQVGVLLRDPRTGAIYEVYLVRARHIATLKEVTDKIAEGKGLVRDASPELAMYLAANFGD